MFTSSLLWVALGGAVGAVLRYLVVAGSVWFGLAFPLGTLLVNVAGSFVIGSFAAWLLGNGVLAGGGRLFFQTGLLGAFTTFSAFSLDTLTLWQSGQVRAAALNVVLNVLLCLFAVAAGFAVVGGVGASD